MVALEKEEETLRNLETERAKILERLIKKRGIIDVKIREQKKKIAILKGEIVKFVKDLRCERHPNARFVRMQKIDNSFLFATRKKEKIKELWIYACKECLKEVKTEKISSGEMSTAYQCPNCGLVKGAYNVKHYRSSEESWRALAGREGHHYYCRICHSQIGYHYWAFS